MSENHDAIVWLEDAADAILAARDTAGDTPGSDLLIALEHVRNAISALDVREVRP